MIDIPHRKRGDFEAHVSPGVRLPVPEPVVSVEPARTTEYLRALAVSVVSANAAVVTVDGGMDAILRQVTRIYERTDGNVHNRPEFFDQARDEIRDAVAGLESEPR